MRGFCVLCAQQISDDVEDDKEEVSSGKVSKSIVSSQIEASGGRGSR